MRINRNVVARKLADYLRGGLPLDKLVDWAEKSMMDGDFGEGETESLVEVVSRLGLADVRAFGLTWEDCRQMFKSLGLSAKLGLVVLDSVTPYSPLKISQSKSKIKHPKSFLTPQSLMRALGILTFKAQHLGRAVSPRTPALNIQFCLPS